MWAQYTFNGGIHTLTRHAWRSNGEWQIVDFDGAVAAVWRAHEPRSLCQLWQHRVQHWWAAIWVGAVALQLAALHPCRALLHQAAVCKAYDWLVRV